MRLAPSSPSRRCRATSALRPPAQRAASGGVRAGRVVMLPSAMIGADRDPNVGTHGSPSSRLYAPVLQTATARRIDDLQNCHSSQSFAAILTAGLLGMFVLTTCNVLRCIAAVLGASWSQPFERGRVSDA